MTNLIETSKELYGVKLAAKNIRIELKAAFPAIKFAVKSHRFAGGNSIDVEWENGPSVNEVQVITNKYKMGEFECMDDSYSYNITDFNTKYGSTKYMFTRRNHTADFLAKVANDNGLDINGEWNETNRINQIALETSCK